MYRSIPRRILESARGDSKPDAVVNPEPRILDTAGIHALLLAKGVIELEQSIQTTNPAIMVFHPALRTSHYARHSAGRRPIRNPDVLSHNSNLHAAPDTPAAASPVDADLQLSSSVLLAEPQRQGSIRRQHERSKAETPGTNRCHEQTAHEGMDDAATARQTVCRRSGRGRYDHPIRDGLGQESASHKNLDDREVGIRTSVDDHLVHGMDILALAL